MSGKDIRDGIEYIEGKEVSQYVGRISGSFDIDPNPASQLQSDDLVSFFVTARLGRRQTDPNDKMMYNTMRRTDTFKVEEVNIIDRDKAQYLLDSLGKSLPPSMTDFADDVSVAAADEATLLDDEASAWDALQFEAKEKTFEEAVMALNHPPLEEETETPSWTGGSTDVSPLISWLGDDGTEEDPFFGFEDATQ